MKIITNKVSLAVLFVIVSLSSCQSQKAWIKRGEKKGWLTYTDSTQKRDSTPIGLNPEKLDDATDSIVELLRQALVDCSDSHDTTFLHDTTIIQRAAKTRQRIKEIIKTIPCEIKPIDESNDKYDIKVWSDGGTLHYNLNIKPQTKVECEEITWYQKVWWLWIILTFILTILGIVWAVRFAKPSANTH